MRRGLARMTALLAAGAVSCAALAGCSKEMTDYSSEVAAECGDAVIYLDEVNLMARYNQWQSEMIYTLYFGSVPWGEEYDGKTMEVTTKEEVMAALLQTEVLISHAEEYGVELTEEDEEKITQACTEFLESSDEALIEAAGATEELLEKVYRKNALANKVWKAITDDIDTEVSAEESQQVGISYVLVEESAEESETDGTDGESGASEETSGEASNETAGEGEESKTPEETANEIVSRVQAGETLDDVAEEMGLTCSTENYLKYGEQDDALGTAAVEMKAGDARAVYDESDGWYAVYCDTENDEDATAAKVDEILEERRDAKFNEVYASWDIPKFKVNEEIWDEIVFEGKPIYTVPDTEESSDGTEEESGSGTEAGTTEEPGSVEESLGETESRTESESGTEAGTTEEPGSVEESSGETESEKSE